MTTQLAWSPLGTAVVDAARDAFVAGVQLTTAVVAVVATAVAVLSMAVLRSHGAPATETDAEAASDEAEASEAETPDEPIAPAQLAESAYS
jgi:hypothetical protein